MQHAADQTMPRASAPAADPATILDVAGVSRRFGPVVANDDISFSLRQGEILGLLGENGAGKSTLIRVIFGLIAPDEGAVRTGRGDRIKAPSDALAAGIGVVHQHFALADNMSVLDNISAGAEPLLSWRRERDAARNRLMKLSKRFGLVVDPDARVGSLSVGERQRVEILKALYRDASILILDEPTAVLTPSEADALFGVLKGMVAEGLSIILVSHKLREIRDVCDRVVVLRQGAVVLEARTAGLEPDALSTAMVGSIPPALARPATRKSRKPALELVKLTARGRFGVVGISDVSFAVHRGEILGVAGVSGNGQTTLSDVLCGLVRHRSGELRLFGQAVSGATPTKMIAAGVGRIAEDRESDGLVYPLSVAENAILERRRNGVFSRWGFLRNGQIRAAAEALISEQDVRCPGPDAPVAQLSGGNAQKVILGRIMALHPRLIVASQPTRGLDVGAARLVRQRLLDVAADGVAVVLISEDGEELLDLSDRLLAMVGGRASESVPRSALDDGALGRMLGGDWPCPA